MECIRERLEMRSPESGKTQPRNNIGQYKKYKTDGSENGGNAADSTRLTETDNDAIINSRINGMLSDLIDHPEMLGDNTPAEWKDILAAEGRVCQPLSDGEYKGVDFSDGGGYKFNFEDGGIFMYHLEEKSHHKTAYYKISTGKKGKRRFKTDVRPNND